MSVLYRPAITCGFFLLIAGMSTAFFGKPIQGAMLCAGAAVYGGIAWVAR